MKTKTEKRLIPELGCPPFAPVEVLGKDDLSTSDRAFLEEQETIIKTGKETFLKVGTAQVNIRDHNNGLLYKRYGTFEDYCRERWEISRSYAHRLMDAAGIYQELLPRGNNSENGVMLSMTEKQIRELGRLETPELRKDAWTHATMKAGIQPSAREVAAAVRDTMVRHGITPGPNRAHTPKCYKLQKADLTQIRRSLGELRDKVASMKECKSLEPLIAKIEAALPPF